MKVLMVSWEYPPVVIGGLGRHVYQIATALAADGHDVVVLSRRPSGTDPSTHPSTDDIAEGVRVVAAAQDPHEFDFGSDMMAWTLAMGHSMLRAGLALKTRDSHRAWHPDVVHAHDWLVAHPAIALAEYFDVPLVSTIHATEAGRHSGWVSGSISRQVVRRGVLAGPRIRLADHMFGVDERRDHRIVRARPDRDPRHPQRNRRRSVAVRTAVSATGPRAFSTWVGWSTKKAFTTPSPHCPRIRRTHPGTTLTVAGDGTQLQWLVEQARKHKVLKATAFVGRVDHEDMVRLLHADAAVLPSHYEPFGIVALEAAATGTPLVTTNVGGLGEAVINGQTGVSFAPRDVAGLAAAVRTVLDDSAAAQRRAVAARERLTSDFDWHTVAKETAQVYLAAKRREREPHPRRPIIEQALPGRS